MSQDELTDTVDPNIDAKSIIEDLRHAIDNLSQFALLNGEEPVAHAYHLDVKEGQIVPNASISARRIMGIARCFISAQFSDSARQAQQSHRDQLETEVLKAVDFLKKHYPILDRLKQGDAAEQKLADAALTAIDSFNQVMQTSNRSSPGLRHRFVSFLLRNSGLGFKALSTHASIDLPAIHHVQCWSPATHDKPMPLSKTCVTAQPLKIPTFHALINQNAHTGHIPTRKESDAFRVKGITLIRNYGFPSTSLTEALEAVRHSPIESIALETVESDKNGCASVITFRQTLEPFPGEIFILEGSFRRDAQNHVPSVPIPKSFKLVSKSTQTGFPSPFQHNAWALSDRLIPPLPNAFHALPRFGQLYQRKKQIARGLLPQGALLKKAKHLVAARKEIFANNAIFFLERHERLLTLLAPTDKRGDIKRLFRELSKLPLADTFAQLRDLYRELMRRCVHVPYDVVQDSWLGLHKDVKLCELDTEQRLMTCIGLYMRAMQDSGNDPSTQKFLCPEVRDIVEALCPRMAPACCAIVLQHMSEKIGFEPPPLEELALKLQLVLYHQLMIFQKLWEGPETGDFDEKALEESILNSLDLEIECLESDSPKSVLFEEAAIVDELASYYRRGGIL